MASASPSLPLVQDDGPVKFHVSLNVSDLKKSQRFYAALLGVEPAKAYADYAKFELTSPPLVLSLKPSWAVRGGVLNHLGFRVTNSAQLVEVQRRLETAGFRTARHDGVECCYAHQTKFWASDPDGALWEIYVLHGDIDHKGTSHGLAGMLPPLRALGFVESVRRGLGKSLGALRCLFSRRCARPAAVAPPPAAPAAVPPAAVGPR